MLICTPPKKSFGWKDSLSEFFCWVGEKENVFAKKAEA